MVGVGAGLANGGKIPFVSAAACFLTARAMEQIKVDAAYSRHNVLVGQSPGHGVRRARPDPPLDRGPRLAAGHPRPDRRRARSTRSRPRRRCAGRRPTTGPVFIRVSRMGVPDVISAGYQFVPGQAVTLRDGDDVTIIATGTAVDAGPGRRRAVEANGVSGPGALHAHRQAARRRRRHPGRPGDRGIVTVEEGLTTGLGAPWRRSSSGTIRLRCVSSGFRTRSLQPGRSSGCWTTSASVPLASRQPLRNCSTAELERSAIREHDRDLGPRRRHDQRQGPLVEAETGKPVVAASRSVAISFPRAGWVEQDANQMWTATLEAASECLRSRPDQTVVGVSISNQRESVVCWSRRTGEPLGPVLGWQDSRTADWCANLLAEHPSAADLVAHRTGLSLDPMFSAPKLRRALEDALQSGVPPSEIALGTVDSWLIWRLTGEHVTEVGNASRTLLLDLHSLEAHSLKWDDELLNLFGIPSSTLPQVRASDAGFGGLRDEVASDLGLPANTPVVAVLADSTRRPVLPPVSVPRRRQGDLWHGYVRDVAGPSTRWSADRHRYVGGLGR